LYPNKAFRCGAQGWLVTVGRRGDEWHWGVRRRWG